MTEEAKKIVKAIKEAFEVLSAMELPAEEQKIEITRDAAMTLIAQLEQVTRERDAETELIGKLIVILKKCQNAATNGCAYEAYREIKKWLLDMRGVEVE